MQPKDRKAFVDRAQAIGEYTHAAILVTLDANGNCEITMNGPLINVTFCSANVQNLIFEMMNQRATLKVPEVKQ